VRPHALDELAIIDAVELHCPKAFQNKAGATLTRHVPGNLASDGVRGDHDAVVIEAELDDSGIDLVIAGGEAISVGNQEPTPAEFDPYGGSAPSALGCRRR
jgi:hypothetical protein